MDLERVLWEARPALFRYAISLCRQREEAEDLVQTAFVRAWERAGLIRERGADACRAYLFKVVHNAYIDRLRKRRPELPAEQAPDDGCWDDLSGPDVEELLSALPQGIRAVVRLKGVEGLNSTEIAEALQIPAATVRTRLRAARLYLKKRRENE